MVSKRVLQMNFLLQALAIQQHQQIRCISIDQIMLLYYLCRRVDSRVNILFGKPKSKHSIEFDSNTCLARDVYVSNIFYKNEILLNFQEKM